MSDSNSQNSAKQMVRQMPLDRPLNRKSAQRDIKFDSSPCLLVDAAQLTIIFLEHFYSATFWPVSVRYGTLDQHLKITLGLTSRADDTCDLHWTPGMKMRSGSYCTVSDGQPKLKPFVVRPLVDWDEQRLD